MVNEEKWRQLSNTYVHIYVYGIHTKRMMNGEEATKYKAYTQAESRADLLLAVSRQGAGSNTI